MIMELFIYDIVENIDLFWIEISKYYMYKEITILNLIGYWYCYFFKIYLFQLYYLYV